jgi:UDP-N-acetylmuramate-alanine ligase
VIVDKNYLESLVIDENNVIPNIEKQHLENYKNLINYIEESIDKSINNDGAPDYFSLYKSCTTLMKTMENLVNTYNQKALLTKNRNEFIKHLIDKSEVKEPEVIKKTDVED